MYASLTGHYTQKMAQGEGNDSAQTLKSLWFTFPTGIPMKTLSVPSAVYRRLPVWLRGKMSVTQL